MAPGKKKGLQRIKKGQGTLERKKKKVEQAPERLGNGNRKGER